MLQQNLAQRHAANLYRQRQVLDSPQGVVVEVDGRRYVNFSSNDYLGLANHPEVVAKMRAHYERWWAGVVSRVNEFSPIHIGSDRENPTMLSPCDWQDVFLDQGAQMILMLRGDAPGHHHPASPTVHADEKPALAGYVSTWHDACVEVPEQNPPTTPPPAVGGAALAAMLTLGATTGSVGQATALLTAYALGLGIPFLLTALLAVEQIEQGLAPHHPPRLRGQRQQNLLIVSVEFPSVVFVDRLEHANHLALRADRGGCNRRWLVAAFQVGFDREGCV